MGQVASNIGLPAMTRFTFITAGHQVPVTTVMPWYTSHMTPSMVWYRFQYYVVSWLMDDR